MSCVYGLCLLNVCSTGPGALAFLFGDMCQTPRLFPGTERHLQYAFSSRCWPTGSDVNDNDLFPHWNTWTNSQIWLPLQVPVTVDPWRREPGLRELGPCLCTDGVPGPWLCPPTSIHCRHLGNEPVGSSNLSLSVSLSLKYTHFKNLKKCVGEGWI